MSFVSFYAEYQPRAKIKKQIKQTYIKSESTIRVKIMPYICTL